MEAVSASQLATSYAVSLTPSARTRVSPHSNYSLAPRSSLRPLRPNRQTRWQRELVARAVISVPPSSTASSTGSSTVLTPEEEAGGQALYGSTVPEQASPAPLLPVAGNGAAASSSSNGAAAGNSSNGAAVRSGNGAVVAVEKIGEGSTGVEELTVEDRPWFEKARQQNVQVR